MQPVISARGLGKRYRIGVPPSSSLKDALSRSADAVRARLRGVRTAQPSSEVWALKDVAFEVGAGEIVGVVGRNGAGKSTLLKLLSRITAPTEGHAVIRGRVGSLLEVGTGFHPDLSGRDNAYLSGAILGMKKAEIDRLFDQIVAFAEIERFIDTPVKHYSTGMYMRLAFAVAAHLETEIVLVDEVLAVGDMAFQKKCLGKMGDVAESGRTVLLVSHNVQAIRSLCPRTLVLHSGAVVADDRTNTALRSYDAILASTQVDAKTGVRDWRRRRGSGAARFTKIEVQNSRGEECFEFQPGDAVRFVLTLDVYDRLPSLAVGVSLRSGLTREVVTTSRHVLTREPVEPGKGRTVVVEFPAIELRPGEYPLYFGMADYYLNAIDIVDDLTRPLVVSTSK
ncbi:MAG: ABC transporter ATP-binding protein, partial [Chloroflexi bacterium]|nr:ABC transporter ATP-binding protein [Chloroflexota bacterium]